MNARRFVHWVCVLALLVGSALYAFILVLDPYQVVPFAPALPRAPISTNQRFAYPALARSADFDSAIVGDSTMRLLDPAHLNAPLGARFVSLAMNSATAYEQSRIHALFATAHPDARHVIVGMDGVWCAPEQIETLTFRAFPEWMYDDDRWNDLLYLFNDKALEDAVRMLQFMRGKRAPRYRLDGYDDFTQGFVKRGRARVAQRIYDGPPRAVADADVAPVLAHAEWPMPQLDVLQTMLDRHSPATRIVLLFPPLHAVVASSQAQQFAECKGRVLARFGSRPNVVVLDYLYVSPLTRNDDNYWDKLHYTNEVARTIELDLARVLSGDSPRSPMARVLDTAAALPSPR